MDQVPAPDRDLRREVDALPVDPDVPREERIREPASRARSGSGRRKAEPRTLGGRLASAVLRRRDVLGVIAVGGALGSLARWGVAEAWPHHAGTFAWSTFFANITGSFLLGILMVFVIEVWPPSRYVRPFLGVGFLGGYTTFSTYMLDTRALLVAGRPHLAGAYLFGTLAAGLVAVWTALLLARAAVSWARRRRGQVADRRAEHVQRDAGSAERPPEGAGSSREGSGQSVAERPRR